MTDQGIQPHLRHRSYSAVLVLTIVAVITTYSVELGRGNADPFNAVALPLLTLLLSGLAVGHGLSLQQYDPLTVGFPYEAKRLR